LTRQATGFRVRNLNLLDRRQQFLRDGAVLNQVDTICPVHVHGDVGTMDGNPGVGLAEDDVRAAHGRDDLAQIEVTQLRIDPEQRRVRQQRSLRHGARRALLRRQREAP
jgi:hypothetical protein